VYSTPDIVKVIKAKRMRFMGHVNLMRESECLSRNPKPFVRTGCRCENHIKLYHREGLRPNGDMVVAR
jgi:hypothetical protein